MIFEPETVKGFRDFLPPESQKRAKVRSVIEKYFRLYGFLPVETPTIEFDELLRPNSLEEEDEAISDRFRLRDKGARNLALRYEFTFQLARIFKQNPNLKLPFKRYQIGRVFRDEPTSQARFREFTQCDADIIGSQNIETDTECLALVSDILKELKIKSTIEINNRKLLNAIIQSVKIESKNEVMRELDKLDKLDEDTVKANLRKYASSNQILTLFKILEKPLDFFAKNLFDGAEEIKKLESLAKSYGFKVKFNPRMVRGLGYYTGNIFEVKAQNAKETIVAGGRYDKVVGRFLNKEIPAVGISFGLDRITNLSQINTLTTKAILVSLNQDSQTIKFSQKLRKDNISCVTAFGQPGKALDYANSYKIPFAIFIGEEEVKAKKFKLKTLDSGEEKLLSEKQLISKLKK